MPSGLSTVLKLLPTLSADELKQVQLKASALLGLSGAAGTEAVGPPAEDYLLEGIHYELRQRGLLGRGRIRPHAGYAQVSRDVRALLDSHVGKLSPVEQAALGQLCASALASYLEKRNVPVAVTQDNMLYRVSKVPVALDLCYPGYLVAGLLPSCWRK